MRVVSSLAGSMVLAVNRDPFARNDTGGKPQPEAEKMTDHRIQIQRIMRLVTVQKYGHAGDGDMGQD